MSNVFHNQSALVTKKSDFNYFHLNITNITFYKEYQMKNLIVHFQGLHIVTTK